MLFLKKLSHAENSGDHIYGIIRGTAENHGGRANSLTAPNPRAQAEVLKKAYQKAGTDPRTITYVEAHGTGTELGDPIEFEGLRTAFKELYQDTGSADITEVHCGLGCVKSNIGHTELAAGVAGVLKVLLQLKHKTIVKTLHCDTVNPYVRLEGAPFYIAKEKHEWKPLKDGSGKELPRRAGVSSFGIGGVNAHAVIEEYVGKRGKAQKGGCSTVCEPKIFVLSAKNKARLKVYAEKMAAFLEKTDADLADIAYTSQTGRDAMEERLAVIAGSAEELGDKLRRFADNKDNVEELCCGNVNQSQNALALFEDEDMSGIVDIWIAKRKYQKLGELWVKGLAFDWNRLYEGSPRPGRVSMPTYPFAKERYWIADTDSNMSETRGPVGRSVGKPDDLITETENYVKSVFADILKIRQSRIESHATFGAYGMSSIMAKGVLVRFEKHFGKLPVTLLLEHKTANALSRYFMSAHQERLVEVLGADIGISDIRSPISDSDSENVFDVRPRGAAQRTRLNQKSAEKGTDFVDSLTDSQVARLLNALTISGDDRPEATEMAVPEMMIREPRGNSLAFMFPGLGDHYVNMGKGLYKTEKTFREQIDICCDFAKPLLNADLRTVMFTEEESPDNKPGEMFDLQRMLGRKSKSSDNPLNKITFTHTAVFVVEYALARLWMERHIRPDAMIGLSLGEYAAACLAGVMSLEDTLRVLIKRAQLIEQLPEGAMLATLLSEKEVLPLIGDELDIGVIGTPYSCMISGNTEAISRLEKKLEEKGDIYSRMQVVRAFHSKEMSRIEEAFVQFLKTVSFSAPQIPYISNVTGTWITDEQAVSPEYWVEHTCRTVRFADGIGELLKDPDRIFLEVGPGQGLSSFVFQHPDGEHLSEQSVFQSLRNENDHRADEDFFADTMERMKKMNRETGRLNPPGNLKKELQN